VEPEPTPLPEPAGLVAALRDGLDAEDLREAQALLTELQKERDAWQASTTAPGAPVVAALGSITAADATRLWQELDYAETYDAPTLRAAGERAHLPPARLLAAVYTLVSSGLIADEDDGTGTDPNPGSDDAL
jgi:hypothetical protein